MKQGNPNKSFKKRLRYHLDLWMSRGPGSMIALLFLATFIIIVILGLLEWLVKRNTGESFLSAVWNILLHALDPGVISGDKDDSRLFLFLMLLATFAGVFFLALLIGFINDAIQKQMEKFAEGKVQVIESGHTVILGFGNVTFSILEELMEAFRNQKGKRNPVVILGDLPKQEMEERLRYRYPVVKNMTIICRSGSIYDYNALTRCSILTSRAVIVCAERDFDSIKAIVACTNILNGKDRKVKNRKSRKPESYITAVINDRHNEFAARIAGSDTEKMDSSVVEDSRDHLELLMMDSTIARIMTHTCCQSGLSKVLVEMFSFSGSELSIVRAERLRKGQLKKMAGKTLRDINLCLPAAYAVGIIGQDGRPRIGDPNETRLEKDTGLILLEKEDDKVTCTSPREVCRTTPGMVQKDGPVTIFILGTNTKLPMILAEMKNYAGVGSVIYLAAEEGQPEEPDLEELIKELSVVGITVSACGEYRVYDYERLKQLLDQCQPDHVITLSGCCSDEDEADEKTLTLLLYLQQYQRESPGVSFGITSEMLKIENQALAQQTVSSDFIISRSIASLMMAQIARNRELKAVFDHLLDSEGFEIYLKPAGYYMETDKEWDLFTISDAVAAKGEIFIGYKKEREDPVLNPAKMQKNKKETLRLGARDNVIVMSEDFSVRDYTAHR